MKKYVFKVYIEDYTKEVTIDELQNADLIDMDKYVLERGGYISLCQTLAEQLKVQSYDIKKIVILNLRKKYEYSIITNNQYIKNLLSDNVEKDSITKSEYYKEMRDYLFKNLESNNYKNFLNNIYTYENNFKLLLTNYSNAYSQVTETEEERINVSNLRQEVEKKLSEYKNYRGLCICRQKSEENINSNNKLKQSLSITLSPAIMTTTKYKLNQPHFLSVTEETEKYNHDNEEFLDPEEYLMMQGDSEPDMGNSPMGY